MILANLRGDFEVGAKESRTKLGDQLLAGITLIAPLHPAHIAGQALVVFGPVTIMPISA